MTSRVKTIFWSHASMLHVFSLHYFFGVVRTILEVVDVDSVSWRVNKISCNMHSLLLSPIDLYNLLHLMPPFISALVDGGVSMYFTYYKVFYSFGKSSGHGYYSFASPSSYLFSFLRVSGRFIGFSLIFTPPTFPITLLESILFRLFPAGFKTFKQKTYLH